MRPRRGRRAAVVVVVGVLVALLAAPAGWAAPPDVPGGLRVVERGGGFVALDWDDLPAGTFDRYQLSVDGLLVVGGPGQRVPSASIWRFEGLTNRQTYAFRVSAIKGSEHSGWSAPVYGTPEAGPRPPDNLRVVEAGDGFVVLDWDDLPAGSFERYQVYVDDQVVAGHGSLPTPQGSFYRVDGLVNGRTYFFRVSAFLSVYGGWTAAVAGTPSADRDGDGHHNARDCRPDDASVHPGAVDLPGNGVDEDCDGRDEPGPGPPDRDEDRWLNGEDCRPDDASVNPGAHDVPQNGVDENCDGLDTPFPTVRTQARIETVFWPSYSRVRGVFVDRARPGTRVEVRCAGRGCRSSRHVVTIGQVRRQVQVAPRWLRRSKLRPGARVTVRLSFAGHCDRVTRFRMRAVERRFVRTESAAAPAGRRNAACDSLD